MKRCREQLNLLFVVASNMTLFDLILPYLDQPSLFAMGHVCKRMRYVIARYVRLKFGSHTELYIQYKGIQCIGSEIRQLSCLTCLNLSNNHLTSIPPELGQLSSLWSLKLENNQLTSIPPELSQLSSLEYLYLKNNRLASIPREFGQLYSLRSLKLEKNPLKSIPDIRSNIKVYL